MNNDFVDILQKLISEQGKEPLLNSAKCKAFLADYTHGEYKNESRLLLQVIGAGVSKEINSTVELEICKKQQMRILLEEYFLAEEAAADVIDTLALVLKGEKDIKGTSHGVVCKNCGNELQKEWKICPYCGTAVKAQQKPTPALSPSSTPVKFTHSIQSYSVESDFKVERKGNKIKITKYHGSKPDVYIPPCIKDFPVTSIGNLAFWGCKLTSIIIPDCINNIGVRAFARCNNLTCVTFLGVITSDGINDDWIFDGDLRDKYLTGGKGTYTRLNGSTTWMKQG